MNKIFIFFILVIFALNCSAVGLIDKYYYAKKNYATAVITSNTTKEIKYLKKLILYGNKLKKNTRKYKQELNKLTRSNKYLKSKKIIKKKAYTNKKYTISNVYTSGNEIIIDFNHNINKSHIKYKEYKKGKYYYDEFDIKGNYQDASPAKLDINGINRIWISQYKYKTLKINLRNKYNTKTIYIISKKRLIIKTTPKKLKNVKNKTMKIVKNNLSFNTLNNKTIVIDAGHGGRDVGAVGPRKRYEKHATLKISKYLYKELKEKGFKVYLTRFSDKYVSLKKRTSIANKRNADIFISIHANSVSKENAKRAKGIETYFLSPARSNRAKRIAAKENSSDIKSIGYSSKNIVLELLNRGKITASQKMAIDIQSHMLHNLKKYYGNSIVDKGVREGPFWVLVGAQMPSVLIEIGYISHPEESKRIYSNSFQKKIAHGIFKGVISYFSKNK